jgi:flavorubredoxin
MIKSRKIQDNVFLLGAIDWDRRLFDAFVPLPDGTSYNAYLVRGSEKTALFDTVDPSHWEVLAAQLREVERVDYVVIHHVEQDHSGSLPMVLERYPSAMVVTNPKCKGMLIDHLHLPEERFVTVGDGETLSLGDHTLKFIYTPWVHLPETMCTWLQERKILFTCDFFASHLARSEMWADEATVYEPAKRYYAEIMMPFANFISKNLQKLSEYPAEVICPSHGPLYARARFILEAYGDWVKSGPKNLVCLAYVSMHGSTQRLVDHLLGELIARGVAVDRFDLSSADLGKIAVSLVDAATIVLGTPTIHAGPHPNVVNAAFVVNALGPKARQAAVIGSYGWGGKTAEKLAGFLSSLKLELLPSVMCKGLPRAEDYQALDNLAAAIATRHEGLQPRSRDLT